MTEEIAKMAAQFLMRVQLAGAEVPAFNAVMIALEQVKDANGPVENNTEDQ